MHSEKRLMLLITLVGGTAVLGSYIYGALARQDAAQVLWGGVPPAIRPAYTWGMFLAAAGYFAFSYFVFFRLDPRDTRVAGRFGFGLFNILYAAILIPSALWMPATVLAIEHPGLVLVWIVRLVLGVVAAASLGLLAAILKVEPRQPVWAHRLALVGILSFCFQTVILDALLWGMYFQP